MHFRAEFGGGREGLLLAAAFLAAAARARAVRFVFLFLILHSARHYCRHAPAMFENVASVGLFTSTSTASVLATERLMRVSGGQSVLMGAVLGHVAFQEFFM